MRKTRQELMEIIEQRHKNTVFDALGIIVDAFDPEVAVSLVVDHRHLQHAGIVHGGIFVLLAESAASIAGTLLTDMTKYNVFGMEINANHVRSVASGKVSAQSRLMYQGGSTIVYGVEITNEKSELVSVSRCTLAVRPKK
jgi:1,4-dihydroxy-2-naphthoyl-CoA hydrolase